MEVDASAFAFALDEVGVSVLRGVILVAGAARVWRVRGPAEVPYWTVMAVFLASGQSRHM